jgi:hypothetical protein
MIHRWLGHLEDFKRITKFVLAARYRFEEAYLLLAGLERGMFESHDAPSNPPLSFHAR